MDWICSRDICSIIDVRFDSQETEDENAVNSTDKPTVSSTASYEYVTNEAAERVVTEDELNDPGFTCIPGQIFRLDCNTCWCAKNGIEPQNCTRVACYPQVFPSLPKK